jgi:lambda family phage portal protein
MRLRDLFRRRPKRRSYEAASTGRLFSSWITSTKSADSDIRFNLTALRARSRELALNNDYARKYLKMVVSNVVGPHGIKLQVRSRDANGKLDQYANNLLETAFYDWARGPVTSDGRMTWVDAQRLFIETMARDGEAFIYFVNVRKADNTYGLQLQFLDPDLVDIEKNDTAPNGNEVRMGVEINAAGKPVAYWLLTQHPSDYQYAKDTGGRHRRIPAEDMLHCMVIDRAGQTRGVPWMSTAMTRLKMLGGYEEAELVAARVSASKMGFFTSPDGEGYTGDGQQGGVTVTDVAPGQFEQLPAGVTFQAYDPQHPSTAFSDFEKAMLRGIASGLNVSYTSLSNDLESVNYSSIRQGLLDERDHWRVTQWWMVEQFCQRVYDRWLLRAMDAGVIALPDAKMWKWRQTIWVPRGWQWVDPEKETNAQVTAINAGLMTMTQALSERGLDIEDVVAERANEAELLAAAGLTNTDTEDGSVTDAARS